jgi:hypothetical protein
MPRGNEAKAIAALFRRAFRPRPDPLDVERRVVHKLVNRALARREQRQVRQILRAAFARLIGELSENGWMRGGDGTCSECASELPRHSFWSKLRPHYVSRVRAVMDCTSNAFICAQSMEGAESKLRVRAV